MEHDVIRDIAADLKARKVRPADPRDLDAAVRCIADGLARSDWRDDDMRNAMRALNGQRLFAHTRTLGKAWLDVRPFDALVTKHYVQALVDLYELDPAEALLNKAIEQAQASDAGAQTRSQLPEYLGLLGRIEKQRFVKSDDKDRLVAATDRYLAQLERERGSGDWFWHGINAVALEAREKREGVLPPDRKTRVSPEEILARMKELYAETPEDVWVPATASEACLALGKCDEAELWLYRFINHPKTEPFNLQSYDRQLREIWQGDPMGSGTRCADRLARIMARHLIQTQSQFTISSAAIPAMKRAVEQAAEGLEKNFLGESTFSLANVRDMLTSCSSIGCVTNKSGARLGTGFVVDGAWLGCRSSGPVFVTNAHVISTTVPKALLPENARVTFEVESESAAAPLFYAVAQVLFTSPPTKLGNSSDEALDVTVVTLEPATSSGQPLKALRAAGALPKIENRAKAYVIGHPLGSGLQISLQDSLLLDIDDAERLVHYRTPTDPGSSGSPVFNSDWEVIGLHHGGSTKTPRLRAEGDYEANEAISLLAIRAHLKSISTTERDDASR